MLIWPAVPVPIRSLWLNGLGAMRKKWDQPHIPGDSKCQQEAFHVGTVCVRYHYCNAMLYRPLVLLMKQVSTNGCQSAVCSDKKISNQGGRVAHPVRYS